jgi:hypothetical protein
MATKMIQRQAPVTGKNQTLFSETPSSCSDDIPPNEKRFEGSESYGAYDIVRHRGDEDARTLARKLSIDDFELIRTLGTGMLQILD